MKRGFTLIELVISISILSVILVTVSGLFVTSFRLNQETSIRQQLYSDARFLLECIGQEIRNGTIDYEEYFNRVVIDSAAGGAGTQYGQNYGLYRRQFYHPGSSGGSLDAYGSLCNNGAVWTPGVDCTIQKETRDQNTGQNPYRGHEADTSVANRRGATSVCGFVNGTGDAAPTASPPSCVGNPPNFVQSELYLISEDSLEKTMFLRERLSIAGATEEIFGLSMVKMTGTDNDGDAFPDQFECSADFSCSETGNRPSKTDAETTTEDDGLQNFVPISPNRLNIIDIVFYIAPLESPFYAFGEPEPQVQHLPFVTIILTVEPNPDIVGGNAGDFRITLQETISTEVFNAPPAPIPGQFADRT